MPVNIRSSAGEAFEARKEAIDRKRLLAEAMIRQSLQNDDPIIRAGDRVVPNWGGVINKGIDAYVGRRDADRADEERKQYGQDYQAELARTVREYSANRDGQRAGTTYEGMTGGLDAQDIPTTPEVKADPRRAAIQAIASGMPEMKAIGFQDLAQLGRSENEKFGHPTMNKNGEVVLFGDRGGVRPTGVQGDQKPIVVGTQLVDPRAPGGPKSVYDAAETYGEPEMVLGVPGQRGQRTNKFSGITGGRVGTQDAVGRAGAIEVVKDQAKALGESKAQLDKLGASMPQTLGTAQLVDQASSLVGRPWADVQLTAMKVAKAMGLSDDEANQIGSAEQLTAMLGKRLLENSRALGSGTGFSNKDLEFLQKIMATGLGTDPRTMKQLAALNIVGYINSVTLHDKNLNKVRSVPGMEEYAPMLEHEMKLNIPPELMEAYQIHQGQDGKMTTGLVPDGSPQPVGPPGAMAPRPQTADEYMRKFGRK